MNDEQTDEDRLSAHLWAKRNSLLHQLRVSTLYHQKRARFFEVCDRSTTAFAVIGSTASLLNMLKPFFPHGELFASGAVAVVSTLGLVFAFGQKARLHVELARDFRRLLGAVEAAGEYPTADQLDKAQGHLAELESMEPSPLTALVLECENQLAFASRKGPLVHLPLYQRLFKNWIDFAPRKPIAQPGPQA